MIGVISNLDCLHSNRFAKEQYEDLGDCDLDIERPFSIAEQGDVLTLSQSPKNCN